MDLKDNSEKQTMNEKLMQLQEIYEKFGRSSFPYSDCRKILQSVDNNKYDGLIPILDEYFSTIAGYASWSKQILKWPCCKIEEVKTQLKKTFFEQNPHFKELEVLITETNTPSLYHTLQSYESMRLLFLNILSQLGS